MPDPFRKVRPGEPMAIKAEVWNAMLGAARAWQDDRLGVNSGAAKTPRNAVIVPVLNASGGDLDRFSVLGLDGPVFDPGESEPGFLNAVAFRGVTPAIADHLGKFCILLEPAKADHVVRGVVDGVWQVKVDVVDPDDGFADVKDAEAGHLESAPDGPAQILWREGDGAYGYGYSTGIQWALVRIGLKKAGGLAVVGVSDIAKKTTSTAPHGTGTIQRIDSAGLIATTGVPVKLFNVSAEKAVKAGALVGYRFCDGRAVIDWADCANLV